MSFLFVILLVFILAYSFAYFILACGLLVLYLPVLLFVFFLVCGLHVLVLLAAVCFCM